LNRFDVLISKIILKKKHHSDTFRNEKYFKKQPQTYSQIVVTHESQQQKYKINSFKINLYNFKTKNIKKFVPCLLINTCQFREHLLKIKFFLSFESF